MNSFGYGYALAVSGSDFYAGGNFMTAGGAPANRTAKWNGSSWSGLDSGMDFAVYALALAASERQRINRKVHPRIEPRPTTAVPFGGPIGRGAPRCHEIATRIKIAPRYRQGIPIAKTVHSDPKSVVE